MINAMINPSQSNQSQSTISMINMGIDLSEIEQYLRDLRQYPHHQYPIKNREILHNHHILALDENQNVDENHKLQNLHQEHFQQAMLYLETSEYLKAIHLLSALISSDVEKEKNSPQTLIQINEMLAYCYYFLAKSEKDHNHLYLSKAKDCFDQCLKLQAMTHASIDDQIQIYMAKAKLEFDVGDQVQAQHLIHQAFEMKKKWHWVDLELLMVYLEIQLFMQKEMDAKFNLYTRIKAMIWQIVPKDNLFKEYFAERIFQIGNWMLKQNFMGFSDLIYQDAIKMAPTHQTLQKVAARRGWKHLQTHLLMSAQSEDDVGLGDDQAKGDQTKDDQSKREKKLKKTDEKNDAHTKSSCCNNPLDNGVDCLCNGCLPEQVGCLTTEASCFSFEACSSSEACSCISLECACPLDCGLILLVAGGLYQLYLSCYQFLI